MRSLSRYSEATLPTPHGVFRLVVYRIGDDDRDEHVAMVCGDVAAGPAGTRAAVAGDGEPRAAVDDAGVLCRVHSSCFTGEVLGSLRCDCRAQLDHALARIAREGRGVVVYLRQEGRGIGLGNKVRAYALQDDGVDTVDANLALGFDPDLRSYEVAAGILRDLGVRSVRLMTNNPAKIEGLEAAGVPVSSHEPHWVGASEHSEAYLLVKRERMGHIPGGDPGGGRDGDPGDGRAPDRDMDRDRDGHGRRPAAAASPIDKAKEGAARR